MAGYAFGSNPRELLVIPGIPHHVKRCRNRARAATGKADHMSIPFEKLKARLLANPKVKAEYGALAPEFEIAGVLRGALSNDVPAATSHRNCPRVVPAKAGTHNQ